MTNEFNQEYQYNNCVSRGVCSVNPRTSSLQEIIILYLKLGAYYAEILENAQRPNLSMKELILNTLSVMVSNTDFSEVDFNNISKKFNSEIPKIIKEYECYCKENNISPKYLKSDLKYSKKTNLTKSIRFGEKEFLKKTQSLSSQTRDLYKILFFLAKSICVNIQDLETFGVNSEDGYFSILSLINYLNLEEIDTETLKKYIKDFSLSDNLLMKKLRNIQTERYGTQRTKDVSYSTEPGKAVLVVGSNIRELEIILESLKTTDIDIYTHDEMILAHTFPYFDEFKNLKGQFGKGLENCLLDFANFPGPVILTRHSLYNIENLYRGRLFTTDIAYSKGVINISDWDFSDVIKSANDAKGFKTGKKCASEAIGFNYDKEIKNIENVLTMGKYTRIIVFNLNGYNNEEADYFEKLLDEIDENTLIISLSCCKKHKNVICINACFDNFAIIKVLETITSVSDMPVFTFLPQCGRNSFSQILYFASHLNIHIFVGKITQPFFNPNIFTTLSKLYNIKAMTTPRNDFKNIKES